MDDHDHDFEGHVREPQGHIRTGRASKGSGPDHDFEGYVRESLDHIRTGRGGVSSIKIGSASELQDDTGELDSEEEDEDEDDDENEQTDDYHDIMSAKDRPNTPPLICPHRRVRYVDDTEAHYTSPDYPDVMEKHSVAGKLQPGSKLDLEGESQGTIEHATQRGLKLHDKTVVKITSASDDALSVTASVELDICPKPYLGGYRNKLTGVIYHNAASQTIIPEALNQASQCSDQTQTTEICCQFQQTGIFTSTQMTGIGIYMLNLLDRKVQPREYITAEMLEQIILRKVLIVQKYCRRWLAQRRMAEVREQMRIRAEYDEQEKARKAKNLSDLNDPGLVSLMNPKTQADFEKLFAALEKWRLDELSQIKGILDGAKRQAASTRLLEQQQQILFCIGQKKQCAVELNATEYFKKFLDKTAADTPHVNKSGTVTNIETASGRRAKELRQMHDIINLKYITAEERLDVLLSLKNTVAEYPCPVSSDILELIDREADLTLRGFTEKRLDGLRQRINSLFLQFCKIVKVNPAAGPHNKVPQDPKRDLRSNVHHCMVCNRYLPIAGYKLALNQHILHHCNKCNRLKNEAGERRDDSRYHAMLEELRRAEIAYEDESKAAFLVQDSDMRYFVINIWDSCSVISKDKDLTNLVFIRWDRCEPWSPNNCVLLTREEAEYHLALPNPNTSYGKQMIKGIIRRQAQGTKYFSGLAAMIKHFPEQPPVVAKPLFPFTIMYAREAVPCTDEEIKEEVPCRENEIVARVV